MLLSIKYSSELKQKSKMQKTKYRKKVKRNASWKYLDIINFSEAR